MAHPVYIHIYKRQFLKIYIIQQKLLVLAICAIRDCCLSAPFEPFHNCARYTLSLFSLLFSLSCLPIFRI